MSTRSGGISRPPWDSFNLGAAVGDDPDAVRQNRERFAAGIGAEPVWLRQVHGRRVIRIDRSDAASSPEADGVWTDEPGVACTIQVADCLPVLFAAPGAVGAAHAGWRGLAAGVVEATLNAVIGAAGCSPADVAVWLGPCIGPRQFEVGADVLRGFGVEPSVSGSTGFRFRPRADGSPAWLADLRGLAAKRLLASGVGSVAAVSDCTVEDRSRFFSFRRDGVCGRMAAAIWICG